MAIEYFRHNHHHADRSDMDDHDPYYYDSDDDGTASDTSEEGLVEVPQDDIPGYFQERDGRLFHSHGSSPYPLPVDADEFHVSRPRSFAAPYNLVKGFER
ncbi:hypothetical protein ACG7TL_007788 [Trametes sanguinea]